MKEEIFWKNSTYQPRTPLNKDVDCDYLIVGGGIVGVSIAYFLLKNKKKVVLIERDTIGSGATGKSAGFLVLKGEIDLKGMISTYGLKKGLIFWKGNHDGLKTIKKIINTEQISCDFEPQHTIYGSILNSSDWAYVFKEYILEKGIEKNTELLVGSELKKEINSPLFWYAIKSYDHGASLNPLKFVQGLSKVVEKKGGVIYEKTPLLKVKKNLAVTPRARIRFKTIILAVDLAQRNSLIKRVRSTIVVTKRLSKKQLKDINLTTHKMIWDSKQIYHYLKITNDQRLLLGYGDKPILKKHLRHETNYPHLLRIQQFLQKLFPQLKIKIEYAWSGDFGLTSKRIPVIEFKGNSVRVGGVGSQVVGVMSAKYIVDKLLNKTSPLDEFFQRS